MLCDERAALRNRFVQVISIGFICLQLRDDGMKNTCEFLSLLALSTGVAALIVVLGGWPYESQTALGKSHFDQATAAPADENLKQGLLLIRQGNYEAAIDSFTQAIYFSRNHYNPDAYKYLGLCYKATRQYAKAAEALNQHLAQVTTSAPDAHIDLAEVYLDQGEFEKARLELEKAYLYQMNGSTFRQKYAMGEMHERMKDPGQALGFYMAALAEKPLYADAWMAKARVEVKIERYNEALADYRAILEKGPLLRGINLEQLYYNMGTCFIKRGDHQGALDHWRMALEQNPDSFDSHLALANLFDSEKHVSSAVHEYQLALKCLPEDNPARTQIARKLMFLEQQLKPKEAPIEVKPSPSMRREYEDAVEHREHGEMNNAPMPKDSGF